MRFVADENVGKPIVERLRKDGHIVLSVVEMEPGISGDEVIQRANQDSALLLTVDKLWRLGVSAGPYRAWLYFSPSGGVVSTTKSRGGCNFASRTC